ncbi:MAG: sigma-70 family RNA polymerase sigma factor [Deltaproteobacteria bacterium]|nr:sigma-70 family RNA polymerase sigma factor [Deltaproteobacteria bacterium]
MSNRTAFENEAVPHLESLLRTAIRMSGDRARAEDAVQETYLRAWRSFRTYQPETNCRAWLFRILVNVIKKTAGKKRHDPLAGAEEVETSTKVIPLFPNAEGGDRQDIQGALDQLTPEFRDVLWLVIVEGFAYKEAAQMLDIPIGTVMSRLYRARRELRRFLTTPGSQEKERASGHGL